MNFKQIKRVFTTSPPRAAACLNSEPVAVPTLPEVDPAPLALESALRKGIACLHLLARCHVRSRSVNAYRTRRMNVRNQRDSFLGQGFPGRRCACFWTPEAPWIEPWALVVQPDAEGPTLIGCVAPHFRRS